jgi:hypothetical protein
MIKGETRYEDVVFSRWPPAESYASGSIEDLLDPRAQNPHII